MKKVCPPLWKHKGARYLKAALPQSSTLASFRSCRFIADRESRGMYKHTATNTKLNRRARPSIIDKVPLPYVCEYSHTKSLTL